MKSKIILLALAAFLVTTYVSAQSSKIGFSGSLNKGDLEIASNFAWYYNWGIAPAAEIQGSVSEHIEYVPMVWGANFDRTALRDYLSAHPEVEYLLGYNEPNISTQSNLGPVAAAAAWPALEAIADEFDLKLVGPAPVPAWEGVVVIENGVEYIEPETWYDAFFEACSDCRVDHIAVHAYYNTTAGVSNLLKTMAKYDKPIWLTEFNHSSYGADGLNNTTYESQETFMNTIVPILENTPELFRYAWFMNRCSTQGNTNIMGNIGSLTNLGDLYAGLGDGSVDGVLDGYSYACYENETVDIEGTMDVAYGANGEFNYKYGVTEDCGCNGDVFGDPIYGLIKACYTRPSGTSVSNGGIDNGIIVHPNPAENLLTVDGLDSDAVIKVYELTGKLVLTHNASSFGNIIDVSGLENSIYMLSVVQRGNVTSLKFIKN